MRGQLTPLELGRRLQQVRKLRGMKQESVAEHLGMARTTVVAIEKGARRLSDEELLRLAQLFAVDLNELLGHREVLDDFAPHLRKPAGLSEPAVGEIDSAIAEFRRFCEDFLTLEELAGVHSRPPETPQYDIEGIDPGAAGEFVAARERDRLALGDAPVAHLRQVLEIDLGLRVFSFPLRPASLAGMYAYTSRLGGCIISNRNHPATRQRWTLAHEYAHHLTRRLQGEITILMAYERRPRGEQFAECFAAHFLMPAMGIQARFREAVRASGDFTTADLCGLASLYTVSVEAMCRRLEDLKLLPAMTWDRLKGGNFRVAEARRSLNLPEDDGIGPELPARYRALAVRLYLADELSEGQLARYLRTDRVAARAVVGEMSSSTEVDPVGNVGTLSMDPSQSLGAVRR